MIEWLVVAACAAPLVYVVVHSIRNKPKVPLSCKLSFHDWQTTDGVWFGFGEFVPCSYKCRKNGGPMHPVAAKVRDNLYDLRTLSENAREKLIQPDDATLLQPGKSKLSGLWWTGYFGV